jgi:hypothetical protein
LIGISDKKAFMLLTSLDHVNFHETVGRAVIGQLIIYLLSFPTTNVDDTLSFCKAVFILAI